MTQREVEFVIGMVLVLLGIVLLSEERPTCEGTAGRLGHRRAELGPVAHPHQG
jgi:hypothetical protein